MKHSIMTQSAFAQLLAPFCNLLVGFSGGLDSTVLLHRLMLLRETQRNLKIRAMHVHHGLSPDADKWVSHCKLICESWSIPLIVKKIILYDTDLGYEGEARRARYAAFASALLPEEALVTAHHLDDQCETFLLALKRGSGPAGLASMPSRISFFGTQQLRPLLSTSRTSLEAWAIENKLKWIQDQSNQVEDYDRNFLRLRVIPILVSRWPYFTRAAARSAQLCAEQESLLDEFCAGELNKAISKEGAIEIAALQDKSAMHRAALLRRWLGTYRVSMPSRDMLTRIWSEVALAKKDANPILHLRGFEIRRYLGKLWLVPFFPRVEHCIFSWPNLSEPLLLPFGMGTLLFQPNGKIRLPLEGERVTIRFQARGVLHIVGRYGGKKLKKLWQECRVPPWLRKKTPLLFYGDTLIAAAGIFITHEGFSEVGRKFTWKRSR